MSDSEHRDTPSTPDVFPAPHAAPGEGTWHATAESRTVRDAQAPPPRKRGTLRRALVSFLVVFVLLAAAFAALVSTGYVMSSTRVTGPLLAEASPEKGMTRERLEAKTATLNKKLQALAPKGVYAVIDTAANRMSIKDGSSVLREAVVSCGSGNVLPNPGGGGKNWVFDTPRGEFKIQVKKKNPIWIKPDWAFVEEGKPVPPRNSTERAEEGVMGDYAMGIGNGYFIHGTLYTRLLGRNVTHGCVRVGDDDLKFAFDNLPVGAKVYLY